MSTNYHQVLVVIINVYLLILTTLIINIGHVVYSLSGIIEAHDSEMID